MPHLKTESGIEWHYDVEGAGEHLLFIHGWGVDKKIWRQQAKFFSQYYQVMTVDLPGHGKSSWKKMNLEAMVTDLHALLAWEQFDCVTVIGSSVGGLIALKLKKGDEVIVIAGKDKGKRGTITIASPLTNKVIVEGVNMVKKHVRANPQRNIQGGIVTKEQPIQASKMR